MPPRTIDNLGIDVSTRYAEDQKSRDQTFIKESRAISIETGIEVTAPSYSAELETLLGAQPTKLSWATFTPPALYFEQRKRLFTHQMIPSMGSEEKQEAQTHKIFAKLQPKIEEKEGQEGKRQKYENERGLEEEEKERKILACLLNTLTLFDRLIIEINSKRGQYQKG